MSTPVPSIWSAGDGLADWVHEGFRLGLDGPSKRSELRFKKHRETLLDSYKKLKKNALDLTPTSSQLANNAFTAMLVPIPMTTLMDESDAMLCLEQVTGKVGARAAKRQHDEDAARVAEEARRQEVGAARRAMRAAIAQRKIPAVFRVDNRTVVHRESA